MLVKYFILTINGGRVFKVIDLWLSMVAWVAEWLRSLTSDYQWWWVAEWLRSLTSDHQGVAWVAEWLRSLTSDHKPNTTTLRFPDTYSASVLVFFAHPKIHLVTKKCNHTGILVAIYFDEFRRHFWIFWWVQPL